MLPLAKSNMSQKSRKLYTLVFVFDSTGHRLLLGMKKRGFGVGKFNGFGGKVEANENIQSAAERELQEECGLTMKNGGNGLTKIGVNSFEFHDHPIIMEVHVFITSLSDVEGRITESEEMRPEWFNFEDIPFEKMWTDDKFWFPLMFKQVTFDCYFLFESVNSGIIIKQELTEGPKLTSPILA